MLLTNFVTLALAFAFQNPIPLPSNVWWYDAVQVVVLVLNLMFTAMVFALSLWLARKVWDISERLKAVETVAFNHYHTNFEKLREKFPGIDFEDVEVPKRFQK